jgi:peptidoglycan/LPS O-acetylase OafA/YrhL
VRLARLAANSRRSVTVVLWLLALCAPFILWITKGVSGPPALGDNLQMAIEFTPILRLPEFMIGILLGRSFLLGDFSRLNGSWLASVSSVVLFSVLAFCPSIPHPLVANGLLAPLFALLLIGLAKGRGPIAWFFSLPLIVVLGEASYSIYILQLPLALLIKAPPPYYSVRQLCIYCIALLLCSVLSWHFVETPLRGYIRRRLSRS